VEEERKQEGKEERGMREGGNHYNILSTDYLLLNQHMQVQTKGFDEKYSVPHLKYTQLIFAATVPFSTLDTQAFTLFIFYAFFSCTLFSYMPHASVPHRILTELSGLYRHSDSSC
jgi:hypothetical protein